MTVATIIGVLLLMASTFVLRMSPEIFDSGYNVTTWSVVIAIWSAPVLLIAGLVIGWVGTVRNRRSLVVLGLVLAAVPVLASAGIIVMAG